MVFELFEALRFMRISACLSPLAVLAPAVGEPVASGGDEPMFRTVDGATTKTVSVLSLDCGEVSAQRWASVGEVW